MGVKILCQELIICWLFHLLKKIGKHGISYRVAKRKDIII